MPNASEAELQQSLRLAAADEFVAGLPNGIDTVVADRGVSTVGRRASTRGPGPGFAEAALRADFG